VGEEITRRWRKLRNEVLNNSLLLTLPGLPWQKLRSTRRLSLPINGT
jgi:hypothetical protein